MKLKCKHIGISISINLQNDITCEQLLDAFRSMAIGIGFQPQTWDNSIIEEADRIKDNYKSIHDEIIKIDEE